MAATNGTRTPPAASATISPPAVTNSADLKRKRLEDLPDLETESQNAQTQQDILAILERWDTNPSFLHHPVDDSPQHGQSPKKVKLTDSSSHDIASKLALGTYSTLEALCADARRVSANLVASIRDTVKEQGISGSLTVADLKQIQRVQALEQAIVDVAEQESRYHLALGRSKAEVEFRSNGVSDGNAPSEPLRNRNGALLTLFGNAPTPKQLFSSLQQTVVPQQQSVVKAELPVEEMSLPNGLTATKILSTPGDGKEGPTLGEAFPPPYNLAPLNPPKAQKRSPARDLALLWEFRDPIPARNKKGGYTVQNLTVGDWLGYGGADSRDDPTSPREKRKKRDRALSGSEALQRPAALESMEEAMAKEEEALFRRAYSSFAPTYDNARALVPERTKSMLWWQKVGSRRYDETFALDPLLADVESSLETRGIAELSYKEEDDFEQAVEELEDLDELPKDAKLVRDEADIDQVLHDVSELLEILASHQRVRNATLPSSTSISRTPISPAPALASRIGRPDSPTQDEVSTYHTLRRELANLILRLPPYVAAKLNGDQLSELGVSRLITFESKNVKGTMEEDQVARFAKYTAMTAAAGLSSLNRSGSHGNQHYSSTSARTPAIGQAANTRYGQSAQYAVRTPATQSQYQRTSSSQSYGTPSASVTRTNYNQYTRPQGQIPGQQVYRNTPSGFSSYGSYNQQYNQSTPQSQQRPAYSIPTSLSQYQARSQASAANAVAYQKTLLAQQQTQPAYNRTASPIKPADYKSPSQAPATIQRTQQYPSSQPQTPVNGFASRPPQAIAQAPPRAASGTPQPPPQATQPSATQSATSGQSNGVA